MPLFEMGKVLHSQDWCRNVKGFGERNMIALLSINFRTHENGDKGCGRGFIQTLSHSLNNACKYTALISFILNTNKAFGHPLSTAQEMDTTDMISWEVCVCVCVWGGGGEGVKLFLFFPRKTNTILSPKIQ